MLEKYKKQQPLFCKYVENVIKKNKISHAYILESNGLSYAFNLAISMASDLLACDIDYKKYPEIKVINPINGVIKKEQIIELQEEFSKLPIYGKYLIYIINCAECLNDSSSNTLLKFLEEPNRSVIGILISSSTDKVIDTIISRCQVLSVVNSNCTIESMLSKYFYNEESLEDVKQDNYLLGIKFFYNIEFFGVDLLTNKDIYDIKPKLKSILIIGIYLYYEMFKSLLDETYVANIEDEKFKKLILDNNGIDDIIRKIEIISDFINKCKYNLNLDMIIDNFIITWEV